MTEALHALLLTDVVDSTLLTGQLEPEAAAELWSAHDRLSRDLIPDWRGREIDKSDGMLLLFDTVADAIGYALAYHQAIDQQNFGIKARAGIHFGPISLRANPAADVARGAKPVEVVGLALPIAARIMAVASGGQTLLSEAAKLALGASTLRLQSHGHWLLGGLAEPIELFEVADAKRVFAAPGDSAKSYRVVRQGDLWQPLRELRHTLPAERDGFVGRQGSLEVLGAKIDTGARLISVVGPGGVGKTRLVTRFGWTRRAACAGGVWFCDLSQARDLDSLLVAVAQGLELPLGSADPVDQLGHAIAGRGRCMLVLDNFEQVAKLAESTLGRWLEIAPLAQFFVTTREVLGITGEEVFTLAPLDFDEAFALFLKRANAARHDYRPRPDDLTAIRQLVTVLDGLPLAVELAAARVRVMAPQTLLARMKDRFAVLLSHGGRRDRQATLRATFDWSWDLLTDLEKAVLARLSVFEGGFKLESAAAVIGLPLMEALETPSESATTTDVVQWLVDKSFVRQVNDERFDLLESVREYAGQHLCNPGRFDGSGPACELDARSGHWRHFASLDERAAVAERCAELSNLVAGCRHAAAQGDAAGAVGCLIGAWAALRQTGPYRAAVDLASLVQKIETLNDRGRAWLHWVAGDAHENLGDVKLALAHVEQGLQCARRANDQRCTARLLIVRGSRQGLDGELDAALVSLKEAERLAARAGDDGLRASALIVLGRLMQHQSRFAESRTHYNLALALATAQGDRRMEGGVLGNLGGIHHALGELEAARSHYQQALARHIETGDRRWEGNQRCNLGLLHQELGEAEQARVQFDMALSTSLEMGHVRLANVVLCNLGILLAAEGQLDEASRFFERAVEAAKASSDRRAEGQASGYLALVLAKLGSLESALAMVEHGEILLVASADSLSHALLLCDRAEIEQLAGQTLASQATLKMAHQLADEIACGPNSELRKRLDAIGGPPAAA